MRTRELAQIDHDEHGMSFLELSSSELSSSRVSVSSVSTISSQASRSSQISDSDLNDVQQSVDALILDLSAARRHLHVLEESVILSIFGLPTKRKPLKGEAKQLEDVFDAAMDGLRDEFKEMSDLGFRECHSLAFDLGPVLDCRVCSGLGLVVNSLAKNFNEKVTQPLLEVQRPKGKMSELFSPLRTSRRAVAGTLRESGQNEVLAILEDSADSRYAESLRVTRYIVNEVQVRLRLAERSRDAFLGAVLIAMEPIVQSFVQSLEYSIIDTFRKDILFSRKFNDIGFRRCLWL